MRRRLAGFACALVLALLAGAPAAHADVFEGTELVSQGFLAGGGTEGLQQAAYAHDPAISADGRYVAFDGSFGGLTGVWRRDLQTGEVQPVAVGTPVPGKHERECEPTAHGARSACDAELPSISEDGQYVSFTTAAPLAPDLDENPDPDVYVRNMDIEASGQESESCEKAEEEDASELTARCPYTLVSAANGSDEGLTYSFSSAFGAVAAGRTAMAVTEHGIEVALVTTAASDLTDPQDPQAPDTPPMQVAVRDLQTRETLLVSTRYDPATGEAIPNEPVSGGEGSFLYGGAYYGGLLPEFPFVTGQHHLTEPVGASISADGSTVAWLGTNVGEQAKILSGEVLDPGYAEPLWRRIDEGPTVPTRRITGGSDPESPACQASGETVLVGQSLGDPCQGPFSATQPAKEGVWTGVGEQDFVPQLSADGYTAAFLANAELLSLGSDFGKSETTSDLYVVDMHPGLTRVQALRPLTEPAGAGEGSEAEKIATTAPIVDFAISPDGAQVAFTTRRTVFALATPTYVSPTAPIPGLVELFDADLADGTLTRVSGGFEGGPSSHPHKEAPANRDPYPLPDDGALSPSFSGDGDTLAFSSTASNLVYGDGNTPATESAGPFDGSDVFVVHRERFGSSPAPQSVSPAPEDPAPTPLWILGASAQSLSNGTVRLYVRTPGPGELRAAAQGWVAVHASSSASRARGARRGHRAPHGAARTASVMRTLATAGRIALGGEGELLTFTLQLAHGYRALASTKGGLSATVELTFTAAGQATLKQSLAVDFADTAPKAKFHAAARTHARATSHARRRGRR